MTTIVDIGHMGSLRRDQGRLSEAEELGAEALRRARGALPGHPMIGWFLRNHARTLVAMERFEQAQAELLEAQEILVPALPAHPRTIDTITALVELYDAWHAAEPNQGYDAQAAEWRARLAEQQATSRPAASP